MSEDYARQEKRQALWGEWADFANKPVSVSSADEFQKQLAVSRETADRLEAYIDLLIKWQKKINLVSKATLSDAWMRHIVDSAQLALYIEHPSFKIVDFGSGAGFPALVLAVLGAENVHLIESDRRKVEFLRAVVRELSLNNVTIHNSRIEDVTCLRADVITARALAPLSQLYEWGKIHAAGSCEGYFLKGKDWQAETKTIPDKVKGLHASLTEKVAKIVHVTF